jgi:hypothetical protein
MLYKREARVKSDVKEKEVNGVGSIVMQKKSKQLTDTILMVRPEDFCFNDETAVDNEFQKKQYESPEKIKSRAMLEFDKMVNRLREENVNVLILEKSANKIKTPDAVFPNNWISTEHDGTIITYPMSTPNRRSEKLRLADAEILFIKKGFTVKNIINIGRFNEEENFLEGTGSLIIDHDNRTVFMAESIRSNPEQLENFSKLLNYKSIKFQAFSSNGKPIYHTNVIMSIGQTFAVACTQCISDIDEKFLLIDTLSEGREFIEISMEQMEKNFCGNILQIKSNQAKPLIVMSQNAYQGFNQEQIEKLKKHGKIISVNIPTIENVGGGSARCMMAEIFLPKAVRSDG